MRVEIELRQKVLRLSNNRVMMCAGVLCFSAVTNELLSVVLVFQLACCVSVHDLQLHQIGVQCSVCEREML